MTSSPEQPPTRVDVAERWLAVVRGDASREAASRWAEPLMFANFDSQPDVLVMSALQWMHGFGMTFRSDDRRLIGHGAPGEYVRSLREIGELFDDWVAECTAFDADPDGWRAEKRASAEAYRLAEKNRHTD